MFFGLDGKVIFFTGVVEDRMDPLKLGRVRIRLHVHHPEQKVLNQKTGTGLKTDELPWAYVMMPVTSPAMDGIGETPLIVEGSHVVGFSRDGETLNDLIILGTIGGRPEDPPKDSNGKIGFVDPRTADEIQNSPRYINQKLNLDPGYEGQGIPQGRYPQELHLKKSNVNRLHRVEDLDKTYIKKKAELRTKNIKHILGQWDEKPSSYGAMYPYNLVKESECGHVIELDDTKLNERYGFWHGGEKAEGTYFEFHPDGSYTLKSTGEIDLISMKDIRMRAKDTLKLSSEKLGLHSDDLTVVHSDKLTTISSKVAVNIIAPLVTVNGKPI